MRHLVTALPIVVTHHPTMRRNQLMIALGWAGALRADWAMGLTNDEATVPIGASTVAVTIGLTTPMIWDKGRRSDRGLDSVAWLGYLQVVCTTWGRMECRHIW